MQGAPIPKTRAAKKTPAARNARKAVSVRAVVVPEDLGAAEAMAAFLVAAQQIPASEILPLRADPALAHHNVLVGLEAVSPREAELAGLPAPFDLGAMKSRRSLSLAVVHATAQVDRASPGKTRKRISRMHELRDILLTSAEALMKTRVLPGPKVRRIAARKGIRDATQDRVDLAQLFREHATAIAGKTAVTTEQLDEAAEVGNELLSVLKVKGAKTKLPADLRTALDARDRLWTMLVHGHAEQLRRRHVALGQRRRRARADAARAQRAAREEAGRRQRQRAVPGLTRGNPRPVPPGAGSQSRGRSRQTQSGDPAGQTCQGGYGLIGWVGNERAWFFRGDDVSGARCGTLGEHALARCR